MSALRPTEPIKKWVVGLDVGSATTAYAEQRLHGPNPPGRLDTVNIADEKLPLRFPSTSNDSPTTFIEIEFFSA